MNVDISTSDTAATLTWQAPLFSGKFFSEHLFSAHCNSDSCFVLLFYCSLPLSFSLSPSLYLPRPTPGADAIDDWTYVVQICPQGVPQPVCTKANTTALTLTCDSLEPNTNYYAVVSTVGDGGSVPIPQPLVFKTKSNGELTVGRWGVGGGRRRCSTR